MGVLAMGGRVMSPTSYRAAPPRTEVLRDNLLHSAAPVNNNSESIAHSVHNAHTAWDLFWGLQRLAPGPRPHSSPSYLPSRDRDGLGRPISGSQAARKDVRGYAAETSFGQVRPDRCTSARRSQLAAIRSKPVSSPALGSIHSPVPA